MSFIVLLPMGSWNSKKTIRSKLSSETRSCETARRGAKKPLIKYSIIGKRLSSDFCQIIEIKSSDWTLYKRTSHPLSLLRRVKCKQNDAPTTRWKDFSFIMKSYFVEVYAFCGWSSSQRVSRKRRRFAKSKTLAKQSTSPGTRRQRRRRSLPTNSTRKFSPFTSMQYEMKILQSAQRREGEILLK